MNKNHDGFTIIELLVVIVVIAILAAITIVAYTGISQKANEASLQSDLDNASRQLKLYQVENGSYPASLDATSKCLEDSSGTEDTRYCLKPSPGNTFSYTSEAPYSTFTLTATRGSLSYYITQDSGPVAGEPAAADVVVGTQTWAPANLNVGTMITGATSQTNNSILEKYCSSNLEANCTTYGGLYQWDEMMQYVTTEGVQGMCPTSYHIPTDAEWTTLTTYLGGESVAGTELKIGGSSGLDIPLGDGRFGGGVFGTPGTYAYLWSSTGSGASAWKRYLDSGSAAMGRDNYSDKVYGFSVRCLKD
jgi:uncharacterized protein (TIGR02145 family)/prepilin-type N-terminal cleavage/methylation domain-containing protein